jgi:hypothetical protein
MKALQIPFTPSDFHQLGTPYGRLEGISKILCFMDDLVALELHDADHADADARSFSADTKEGSQLTAPDASKCWIVDTLSGILAPERVTVWHVLDQSSRTLLSGELDRIDNAYQFWKNDRPVRNMACPIGAASKAQFRREAKHDFRANSKAAFRDEREHSFTLSECRSTCPEQSPGHAPPNVKPKMTSPALPNTKSDGR